jgi:AraC family transcriptional regulator of adaptative response / DNA-3-methyladenine glycosylase II
LRAVKESHPDDFARGADPVLQTIESLVDEIGANPAALRRRPWG